MLLIICVACKLLKYIDFNFLSGNCWKDFLAIKLLSLNSVNLVDRQASQKRRDSAEIRVFRIIKCDVDIVRYDE